MKAAVYLRTGEKANEWVGCHSLPDVPAKESWIPRNGCEAHLDEILSMNLYLRFRDKALAAKVAEVLLLGEEDPVAYSQVAVLRCDIVESNGKIPIRCHFSKKYSGRNVIAKNVEPGQ
jgi:hypothetical protein